MSILDLGSQSGHAKPLNNLAGRDTAHPSPRPCTLTASRLKVTTPLNADELNAVPAPEGQPRITLCIRLASRTVTAEIASNSLRKAQTAIREASADDITARSRRRIQNAHDPNHGKQLDGALLT
jgi:hypothetical protein